MKTVVELSKIAEKQIQKLPRNIIEALFAWVQRIEYLGIQETRKIKGYHDEPLRGKRKGQRSVRLSKAYRAIYIVSKDNLIEIVTIAEVTKHDY